MPQILLNAIISYLQKNPAVVEQLVAGLVQLIVKEIEKASGQPTPKS